MHCSFIEASRVLAGQALGGLFLSAALLVPALAAPGPAAVEGEVARAWAGARARDAWKGFAYWSPGGSSEVRWDAYAKLSYPQQTHMLLDLFKEVDRWADVRTRAEDRRAALILLDQRPLADWAAGALELNGRYRDELVQLLYRKGYQSEGGDPWSFLAPYARLDRPWTHGLGLHVDGADAWRFQWIPSPILMTGQGGPTGLPAPLEAAAQPAILVHLEQLKSGLDRLRALAGGDGGMVAALAQGTRFGFLLQHLEYWLDHGSPVLGPLAQRPAWILHYGVPREGGPDRGTLFFLPGDLPLGAKLALDLMRLNPLWAGARIRSSTWTGPGGRSVPIAQIRGTGGVLNLASVPGGTFICDGEGPLRAVLFPGPMATLGERPEWCRTALAGMGRGTRVSLWVTPRTGAGPGYELAASLRRETGGTQDAQANPAMAKAAPCTGAAAVALGTGPTERLLGAILRADVDNPVEDPPLPAFVAGQQGLTEAQARDYQAQLRRNWIRREQAGALRARVDALAGGLDLRGAALFWNGWVPPPPLSPAEKAGLADFQKMRGEDPHRATSLQRRGQVGWYGGYGEPGLAPSLALAVAVVPGQEGAVRAGLGRIFSQLFKGQPQKRALGPVELHRVATGQSFMPAYTLVNGMLVLGTDDAAVQAVAAGLMGQVPTLADSRSPAFGRCQLDGPKLARHLEALLLAYTRAIGNGSPWWWLEGAPGGDDASAEVASTFGPFLGALRSLGRCTLELDWGPWGLEATPR